MHRRDVFFGNTLRCAKNPKVWVNAHQLVIVMTTHIEVVVVLIRNTLLWILFFEINEPENFEVAL